MTGIKWEKLDVSLAQRVGRLERKLALGGAAIIILAITLLLLITR